MPTMDGPATGGADTPDEDGTEATLEEGLQAAGWDAEAISAWLSAPPDPDHPPDQHLLHVLSWARLFPDATTAREWFDSALELEDAAAWHRAGFSLPETEGIQWRVVMAALSPDVTTIVRTEESWRSSGLPGAWIIACLDAGITDVAPARELFDLRSSL